MSGARKPSIIQYDRPIVLVGMMGAGKTTVGRRLAQRLKLPFLDADHEIESAAGMSVSELFQRHGEESFRTGEARIIGRIVEGEPCVLATGGGAVTHPETRQILREKAITVWIKADLATLARRATRRNTRPLLKTGDPETIIKNLLVERAPYYSAAHIEVDSQPGPHANTVEKIIEKLEAYILRQSNEITEPNS